MLGTSPLGTTPLGAVPSSGEIPGCVEVVVTLANPATVRHREKSTARLVTQVTATVDTALLDPGCLP